MWTRVDLKMRGKQAFQRNYWSCVAVAFVMSLIAGLFATSSGNSIRNQDSYYFSSQYSMIWMTIMGIVAVMGIGAILLSVFVGNVLLVGGYRFFVLNRTEMPTAGTLGYGFKSGSYINVVLIMFLRSLFTSLWTLLFVVPGIIKHYEYLMIPYILAENPGMGREEAFLISKKMMNGQKWDAFVLELSFIGWWILGALTCGLLGIFYVQPYREATFAELYSANREMAYQNGYIR